MAWSCAACKHRRKHILKYRESERERETSAGKQTDRPRDREGNGNTLGGNVAAQRFTDTCMNIHTILHSALQSFITHS